MEQVYRQARWVAGGVVVLLLAQLAYSWPTPLVPGAPYLFTVPSRASLAVSGAPTLGGFEVKPLGRAPGPLQLGMEQQANFTFVVSAFAYQDKTVHFKPEQLRSGQASVSLEPSLPLLSPALYLVRDFPFALLGLITSFAFGLFKVRPRWRHLRSVQRLLSQNELSPGAELMGYAVQNELGRGGMSRVYKVRRIEGGEILALKVLRADWARDARALARFRNEIDLWRGLSHPNIVHLLDWGEAAGFVYLVTELVDGQPLDEAPGQVTMETLESWAEQLVSALEYAHGKGLAHRDIKPGNLLLDGRGRVFLLDFGIAARHAEVSQGGGGTVGFMPPEQLRGEAGPAADYYALGVTLYTLAAGHQPFQGDDNVQVLARQARSDYRPLAQLRPDCAPSWQELIDRLLCLDPEQRLSQPEEVRAYLSASRAWRVSSAEE